MATRRQISIRKLKEAFSSAEDRLKGERNRLITEVITNEAFAINGEGLISAVIARALHDTFSGRFVTETEVKRIDLCLIDNESRVVVAIEGKWMVSNNTTRDNRDGFKNSLDVHGIRASKLGSVEKDITGLGDKIRKIGKVIPHYEIFVPIVCELYRTGGEDEWFKEKKPWTTDPRYEKVRRNLRRDLTKWFTSKDDAFKFIHATERIELVDANHFWQEQSAWLYPKYKSLEAYVSFYAFGRYVPK